MSITKEKAISMLECMAIDMVGAIAGMRETNPMLDVLQQRIEAINLAQSVLRSVSREQVEKVWKGEWETVMSPYGEIEGWFHTECGRKSPEKSDWCPECGKAMTGEAVQMVIERLEALTSSGDGKPCGMCPSEERMPRREEI